VVDIRTVKLFAIIVQRLKQAHFTQVFQKGLLKGDAVDAGHHQAVRTDLFSSPTNASKSKSGSGSIS